MDCQRELLAALVKKLGENTNPIGINALLGHDPGSGDPAKIRIGTRLSDINSDDRPRFLAVHIPISTPLSEFPSAVYRGIVEFEASACGEDAETLIITILDRLNSIFYGSEEDCIVDNRWFWNFSTTKVRIRQAIPLSRSSVRYDEDRGRYIQSIRLTVIWSCASGCG